MLQPGDGDEKEAALREEWTAVVESSAAADRSEELQRLRHTIRMREAQQRRSRIFRRIRYAAAAAAVLLFAVGEYYYVRSASAVPAEIRLLTARGEQRRISAARRHEGMAQRIEPPDLSRNIPTAGNAA